MTGPCGPLSIPCKTLGLIRSTCISFTSPSATTTAPDGPWSGYTGRGRSGLPEEVANVALFLVSDETSYVSGAVYSITGG